MIFRRPRKRGGAPVAPKPRGSAAPRNERRRESAGEVATGRGRRIAVVLRHAVRIAAGVAITISLLWGGILAWNHATTSAYFAVDEASVSGTTRLGEREVLEAAGFEAGMNVFRIDTEAMTRALAAHPWILEAKVRRRIPRSLSIEIAERRPEALVLFDMPYLVDDTGEIFKRWAPGDPVLPPVVTGLSREQFALDGAGVAGSVRDAIAFTRRYRAAGLDRAAPLAEVHCEADGGITAVAGADPFVVRFGIGPYRGKLARLATLLGKMRGEGRRPAVIYLDNEVRPDRVTVKIKTGDGPPVEGRVDLGATGGKKQSKI